MSVNSDIREGIQAIARMGLGNENAFSAEVVSVDISTRSCSVLSISGTEQVSYDNVWLMPCVDDGILYLPKVGSTVIVENNKDLQPYISMWSAIDQIFYVINNTTFKMVDGKTTFNTGDNGGIPNVKPLVDKIVALEKLVNDLITKYNTHTHILTLTSGTGTAAPTTTQETGTISPLTTVNDIEDKKVVH